MRVKFDAKWRFLVSKSSDDLASFRIPKLNLFIKTRTQKLAAIISELDISDRFGMTSISSETFSICIGVPDFASTIMAAREEQMTEFRKESNSLHTFGVTLKRVHPFLRDVVLYLFLAMFHIWRYFRHLGLFELLLGTMKDR